ncbi:MAG: hypothetical protein Q7K42_03425, partial [Candidatus Diapherotrites archaeon]|nr:hypothetical protein [Candidatus Diapherotrites archaeon]
RAQDGIFLLTKGDSKLNPLLDQDSSITNFPIVQKDIQGRAVLVNNYPLKIPLLGYVKLLLFDDLPKFLSGISRA